MEELPEKIPKINNAKFYILSWKNKESKSEIFVEYGEIIGNKKVYSKKIEINGSTNVYALQFISKASK